MKTNGTLLLAALLISNQVFAEDAKVQNAAAQNTTTTTILASAEEAGTNASLANESAIAGKNEGVAPTIKYTGFFFGPGMDFSQSKQAGAGDGRDDMALKNRPKFLVKVGENIEAGIDTRFNILFNSESYKAKNDNYRLQATFKKIVKTDTFSLAMTPRLMLPTSNKAHDTHTLVSPELVTSFDFNPKNTRFSVNGGVGLSKFIYSNKGSDSASADATTFDIGPWAEIDFQVSPAVQAMVAYWPDFTAKGNRSGGFANASNEIDMGVNWDFVKGWTLIPYVSLEMNGVAAATNNGALQNMQANLIVTGPVF